ncbi:MAG: carboxyl-terminal processing protease [Acidobacteriota bacterium]|jgi:carboxyl-terminal processing protease|nr:carboxyl-terminal processing protease [Acidobacteriota bacterium]
MLRFRPLTTLFLILFVIQSAMQGQEVPRGETTVAVAPPSAKPSADAERRRETFEIVWRTVKENHFDPSFGGVNWDAVHTEFAPRVEASRTDRELHLLLQQMLNRLGQSHFNIIPPEAIPSTDAEGRDDDEEDGGPGGVSPGREKPHARGSVYMAEHLTYGIGIDLRVVGGAALITRIETGSTAERAGLRTGFVLRSINGQRMSDILGEIRLAALYEPAARNQIPAEVIVGYINGSPNTSVRLTFLDARNRLRRAVVAREHLRGELAPTSLALPAQFVEFESKRLRNQIGYIRFNLFVAPVLEKFCAALRSMKDAPGVVLDLRGNRGGLLGLIYGMGGLLETSPTSFGVMRTRAGWHELVVTPQRNAYSGQLVVLIDAETQSAGEIFAGGLQASGRAVVVGQRSAGATLPSAAKELPTGAILQYAFADFVTANGNVIEGNGVTPNIHAGLNRRRLLAGRDPQLEAALDTIDTRDVVQVVAATAPPPPPAPITIKVANVEGAGDAAKAAASVAPEVEPILAKYDEAVGGRARFEKLSTRVSKGKIEGAYAGMRVSGTLELLEKAPDKYVALINVDGLGVVRRGFTGEYGYMQIPLSGYREIQGGELAALRIEARSGWAADLRRLYPSMVLKGKETVGGAEAYVVEASIGAGTPTMLYFDTRTGLLVRRDGTYFEDYREVDGVKLPFRVRDDFSVITLTEVKHNLPLDDARFIEEKNCFTQ